MTCKDTSLTAPALDTTLGDPGGGAAGAPRRLFPGESGDSNFAIELPLWDSISAEPMQLAGTPFRIYSLRRAKNRHPLYAEPSGEGEWQFHGPWEMMGALTFDQAEDTHDTVDVSGIQSESTATLYISRREYESSGAPDPKDGDIIHFWNRKPFGIDDQFWDVVQANRHEAMFSSEVFIQYQLSLTRRTPFDPGRKVIDGAKTPVHDDQ
jgi:hypothetical protein